MTDLIKRRDDAAAARRDAEAAEARAQATAGELDELEQVRAEAARRAADARSALDSIERAVAQIPDAQAGLRTAEQSLADIVAQLADLDARIGAVEAQIERFERRGRPVPRQLSESLQELQRTRDALEQRQREAVDARAQADARLAQLQAETRQLARAQAAVDEAVAELTRIDNRRSRLALAAQAARNQASVMRATAEALEAQLQSALDHLIPGLRTDIPIALLPVRIETRFRISSPGQPPSELLIRVYPDDIHSDTHELGLTDEEDRWGKHFWRETWRAGRVKLGDASYPQRRAQELAAWQQLATRFGPTRAAYIARRLTPVNEDSRPPSLNLDSTLAVEPDFDARVPTRPFSWTRAAQARALPERWLAIGSRSGHASHSVWGALIPAALSTGPDPSSPPPSPAELRAAVPVDSGMRWMVDFAEAEAKGMGIRMALSSDEAIDGFDRLVILGVKGTLSDPKDGARELRELIEAHRFTWGCGFVPQGTPTNNTEQVNSGYSREDVGFQRSFALEREELRIVAQDGSDGAQTALALGLDVADLGGLRSADGHDQRDAAHVNRVLWPVTIGYFLSQFFNDVLPGTDHDVWREYFVRHVRARGPLPAMRVGRQPYGLLPVTSLDRWVSDRMDLVDVIRSLRQVWRASLSGVAYAGRSSEVGLDLVETLGLEAISSSYSWRWARGPRFFDLFWRLPGQEVDPPVLDAAKQLLGMNLRAVLQSVGLSDRQWTRLTATTFARVPFTWEGPLVEAGGLSETQPLRHNYVRLLADPLLSLDDVHGESPQLAPLGEPRPLLYRLLRHATLLAYAEQALHAWPAPRSSPVDPPWFEPELVDVERDVTVDGPGDPSKTPTFWRVLQTVRAGAPANLGDGLRTQGQAVPDPLHAFLESLTQLADVPSAALARLLGETLDLASHRLDSWMTSLATSRLGQFRAAQSTGIYVGGYSWMENVRPRQNPSLSDGFVHAPSIAQATTAAVLRSGYLAHQGQPEGARLEIDLSSRRVRLAQGLIDGVRQGQPLGALLGYRFERALHDGDPQLNRFIAPLRSLAPLTGGQLVPVDATEPHDSVAADHVVDGLKLLDLYKQARIPFATLNPSQTERAAMDAALNEIADAVDAIGDLAMAEGVHQAVQGNYLRAGATLDAISRGETPGDIQVVTTPQSGVAFTQRLIALFSVAIPPATSWNRSRARAVAEPVLNAWAEQLLGPPGRVRCQASYFNPQRDPLTDAPDDTAAVFLDALDVCALDIVYAPFVTDDAQRTELQLRLARAAIQRRPATIEPAARVRLIFGRQSDTYRADELTFPQLFELARVARELITNGRPLDARDLARAGTAGDPGTEASFTRLSRVMTIWGEAKQTLRDLFDVTPQVQLDVLKAAPFNVPASAVGTRVNLLDLIRIPDLPSRIELVTVSSVLEVPDPSRLDDLRDALDAFSAFAVQSAVPRSIGGDAAEARRDLVLQAGRVYSQVLDIDERQLNAIKGTSVGDTLARLAVLFGEGFRVLPSFTLDRRSNLQSALQRRVQARDAGTEKVMPWLQTVARVRDGARRLTTALTYAEVVDTGSDMAFQVAQLPFDEQDRWNVPLGPALAGATSLVIHARDDLDLTGACAGLMIDEWVEVIPSQNMQTALTFHYDAPGARAPQAILLAISPDPGKPWDTATLEAILKETLELTKLRAVDYDALSSLGHLLPAVFIAHSAGGDPHGDTVSSSLGQ